MKLSEEAPIHITRNGVYCLEADVTSWLTSHLSGQSIVKLQSAEKGMCATQSVLFPML